VLDFFCQCVFGLAIQERKGPGNWVPAGEFDEVYMAVQVEDIRAARNVAEIVGETLGPVAENMEISFGLLHLLPRGFVRNEKAVLPYSTRQLYRKACRMLR
jgi:hypothetical protein